MIDALSNSSDCILHTQYNRTIRYIIRRKMPCVKWSCINSLVTAICCIGTVIMVCYWIVRYHKNEDVSSVEYQAIDTMEDPTQVELTLCMSNPVLEDKIKKIRPDLNGKDYIKYLRGEIIGNQTYEMINYENVAFNLFDHFKSLTAIPRNDSNHRVCSNVDQCRFMSLKNSLNGFSYFSANIMKCFTIGIDSKESRNIKTIHISFGSTLKPLLAKIGTIRAGFTYPEQLLVSAGGVPIWENPNETMMWHSFTIRNMEILKQRYKGNNQCEPNWKVFDSVMIEKHIKKTGCRPPYLSNNSKFSLCNTQRKLKNSLFERMYQPHRYNPPCQGISKLDFKYDLYPKDYGQTWKTTYTQPSWYSLIINYPDKMKVITQVQAVDFQALVGYVGGYVGLFLGNYRYSISCDVIEFLMKCYYCIDFTIYPKYKQTNQLLFIARICHHSNAGYLASSLFLYQKMGSQPHHI